MAVIPTTCVGITPTGNEEGDELKLVGGTNKYWRC